MHRMKLWAFGLGLIASGSWSPAAEPDKRLHELAEKYFEAYLQRHPTWATSIGDYRFIDRLDDVSRAARTQWEAQLRGFLGELRNIDEGSLSSADRLTADLLRRELDDSILHHRCGLWMAPMEPLNGPHITFPLLLVSQPFRDAADYRAYLTLLRSYPRYVLDQIANMRMGLSEELVSPRVVVEKTIPQIRTHLVKDPTASEFYSPLRNAASLVGEERAAIEKELVEAISENVVPAYLQLLSFIEDEYLPRCRETVGIGHVRRGKEIYEALAYLHTTTSIKPEEIHELGLAEVSRIRDEMTKVQREMGFEGSLDEFLTHMRTDPKYRFTSGKELYDAADEKLKWAKTQMPKLFNRLPKANCEMKEIESFRAAAAPVAYYNPAPFDGSRPGYYYINTYAPQERLRFTLEALTYHEAVPGHHLQIALDQENADLPRFRRYGTFTAYVEGWALYTEKLGYEIGGYRTPQDRFGQLTFEMWRACRLVVDTGMHLKGWTRERAIEFMGQNTSLARLDIESEIDRYIAWPGQALAYKIGELRILQMRRDAEKALGDRFDLKAFHDVLLAGGAMPIEILEARMKEWIDSYPR